MSTLPYSTLTHLPPAPAPPWNWVPGRSGGGPPPWPCARPGQRPMCSEHIAGQTPGGSDRSSPAPPAPGLHPTGPGNAKRAGVACWSAAVAVMTAADGLMAPSLAKTPLSVVSGASGGLHDAVDPVGPGLNQDASLHQNVERLALIEQHSAVQHSRVVISQYLVRGAGRNKL